MKREMTPEYNAFITMLKTEDYVVLDTETTGLHEGEICSIAIVHKNGTVLMDKLVKPARGIPAEAVAIHGITDAKVAFSPYWMAVRLTVQEIIQSSNVVVYNAAYDRRMMYQSNEAHGVHAPIWREVAKWHCAMENYAELHGDWNDYHQSYRWQRLSDAVVQMGLMVGNAHSALGDCLMTLALCKTMAGEGDTELGAAIQGLTEDNNQ